MIVRSAIAVVLAIGVSLSPVTAEDAKPTPKPFADFKAKRIKPPKSGAGKRITVQITPRATPAVPTAPQNKGTAPKAKGSLGWYWAAVSPKLDDTGPGRLQSALVALGKGPAGAHVPAPRLQSMQNIAQSHGVDILTATIGTRVSPALALAVISIESAGKATAESHAGAQGLMQLMPATAARFGVTDSLDTKQNIKGGIAYLDWLMEKFDNDPIFVLAGYNAGENAVTKHGGVPPYAETRDYVPKVLAAFQVARGLCLTPPELVTDGCVFRVKSQ